MANQIRNETRSGTDRASGRTYGKRVDGLVIDGLPVRAGVFDEREVRAAAGLTLVLGAVAFVYALFAKQYLPIKLVTAFFVLEFAVRVAIGLQYSPLGQVARALTWRQSAQWVSAQPKRFAWSLGLVLSLVMTVVTNADVRGTLPMTICLICLTLMWLEAVLGLCLGCEIHGVLRRRGWIARDDAYEVCSSGACASDDRLPARVK